MATKAYVIVGGDEKDRRIKAAELRRDDRFRRSFTYASEDEPEKVGVILTDDQGDFETLSLKDVEEIIEKRSNGRVLEPDFRTSAQGEDAFYGVIALPKAPTPEIKP